MNDNATLAKLVYAEELALGASERDATLIAQLVRSSPGYRIAWLAERAAWRKEKEEVGYCPCLTGCPECGGVPNHVAWLRGTQAKEDGA